MKKYLLLFMFGIVGCCPPEKVCPTPILVNCESKVWPVETSPALLEVVARRLDDPNVIAGLTQEDLNNLGINITKLFTWGSKNQTTLIEINKQQQVK